jgi:hypothetical protein
MREPYVSAEDRVAAWMAAWNADDEDERRRLISVAFTEHGRYVAPLVDVAGVENIAAALGDIMALHPGYRVRRSSEIQRHFDHIRFNWQLLNAENSCFLSGTDIAQIDGDCRFLRLAGFAGDLEEYSLEA